MRDGVDRVGELAFNALSNALFNVSTLWWSSVAELVGAAAVGMEWVGSGAWMLVEWFEGSFDGVGESLFMSEMNLVVVAVGLCSSSEDEEDGEVFKMFGFEMLLSLITHCKMSQLSKNFSG